MESKGETGANIQTSLTENVALPPRINEIPPNVKIKGFSTKDDTAFVRRAIESSGLPVENIPKIRFVGVKTKAFASVDPKTGEMSFHLSFERQPRTTQFRTIIHELAHENEPFEEKNVRIFGSEENMKMAADNVKKFAEQTKATGLCLGYSHKGTLLEFEGGKIDEQRYLSESYAEMIEFRYRKPERLRQVLESQNKDTAEEIMNGLDNTLLALNPHLKTKEELNTHIDNLQSWVREVSNKREEERKKQPFLERSLRKILSPERATELLVAFTMEQIEIVHDMQLYPTKYGMTQNQAGEWLIPQDPPMAKWAMDNIGDIWEISAGFTAMRLGFVALNEVLKKEPIKKLTGGYQVSDDAAFWTSLMTTWTVKAAHSMGWISSNWLRLGDMPIGAWHDHTVNPVPGMIFGQGVAAAVLVATHYTTKYREPIKNFVVRAAKFTGKKFKEFDTMMNNLGRPKNGIDIAVDILKEQNDDEKP